jgi:peptidoglycan/xylan/chitin deacetylase (PgdA/CDA1 family)
MQSWPLVGGGAAIAACAAAWAAVHPRSQIFGPTLTATASSSIIALTFDDGPNPAATPPLLDLLERHGVTATFFVIGRWALACPDVLRATAARGHAIGNHTQTHPNLIWLRPARIVDELVRCQDTVDAIARRRPTLVRPPYGFRGPQLNAAVARSGLRQVVTWSVMGRDWTPRGQRALRSRLSRVRGGDIVVLHDGSHETLGADRTATLNALAYWLPRWRDAGLRCAPLGQGSQRRDEAVEEVGKPSE